MRRLLAAGLVVTAAVSAMPGTASAHLHYVTFDETAVVDDQGAVVSGVIECHPGWAYALTVKLENAQRYQLRANLKGRPICTGTPQPFAVRVGGEFVEGPAAISVTARGGTRSEGILHSLTSKGSVELVATG